MGDGRYYTLNQFISIVYLTVLIIFMVISFIIYLYKVKNKMILGVYIGVGISVILSFIEKIVVSAYNLELFGMASNIFLWLSVVLYILLLIRLREAVQRKVIISMGILFLMSLFILVNKYDTKMIIYLLFIINLNILAMSSISYRINSSIFGDVKELILDYVFIVDDSSRIIYKNNNVEVSGTFNNADNIDVERIESFFIERSTIRRAYNKSFVKLVDNNIYYQYSKKEIMNRERLAGYIVTFTDITELVKMLDKLKLKEEETNNTNIKLSIYKEIVYDTEHEKEINNLLTDISRNQQKSMHELKVEIELLIENKDGKTNEKIQETIKKAKDSLLDIRNAVTEYRNYYEKQ